MRMRERLKQKAQKNISRKNKNMFKKGKDIKERGR